MLRAGNSGDGMADLSGCAAAPVRQRLEGFWRGAEGGGRNQPEATEEPDGTIRETSNVTLEQNQAKRSTYNGTSAFLFNLWESTDLLLKESTLMHGHVEQFFSSHHVATTSSQV